MAVVLKEQLELRPSVALQKKVGLKSLEQVIRWGDRVNQELRRLRKLEDRKCWRARARSIRKKSRSGSSGLSKAQALVEIEQQERGYQKEVAKVRKTEKNGNAKCTMSLSVSYTHLTLPTNREV